MPSSSTVMRSIKNAKQGEAAGYKALHSFETSVSIHRED